MSDPRPERRPRPLTWVVGAGGLLGSPVTRSLMDRGEVVWRPATPVPWGSPAATEHLASSARAFAERVSGGPWQLAWCAGAAVTGTTAAQLEAEVTALERLLASMSDVGLGAAGPGAVFVASSAGGVYAGSSGPPFDERTTPRPISPYGDARLEMEELVRRWATQERVPALLGRIANLYGPGQNMAKPQGLISQLVKAHLVRRPLSVYVPLDTIRDYLYAPDCGRMVVDALRLTLAEGVRRGPRTSVKVLASQRGVTIGAVIGELRRVFKRPPNVIYGTSPAAKFQIRDLRVRSVVMPEVDRAGVTPLPAGLRATVDALSRALQDGQLLS